MRDIRVSKRVFTTGHSVASSSDLSLYRGVQGRVLPLSGTVTREPHRLGEVGGTLGLIGLVIGEFGGDGLDATAVGVVLQAVGLGMIVAVGVIDRRARTTFGHRGDTTRNRTELLAKDRRIATKRRTLDRYLGSVQATSGVLMILEVLDRVGDDQAGRVTRVVRDQAQRGHVGISGTGALAQLLVGGGVVGLHVIIDDSLQRFATLRGLSSAPNDDLLLGDGIGLALGLLDPTSLVDLRDDVRIAVTLQDVIRLEGHLVGPLTQRVNRG